MSVKITRALLSVSDKAGIVDFAKALAEMGVELVSTGGTATALRNEGVKVKDVCELTGFPEMMDGRVKTLHPNVHGALLYRRNLKKHVDEAHKLGIEPIDLVVVNLYPFEATVARAGITVEEAIEQIDIGGPSMIRSAAKNHESVTVIVDPADYAMVLAEMQNKGVHGGMPPACATRLDTRKKLAAKVFATTSAYDAAICRYLEMEALGQEVPEHFSIHGKLRASLRYGENPHQKGAGLYRVSGYEQPCVVNGKQISGKPAGFNNIFDANAAFEISCEFPDPTATIIKHQNQCGCATATTLVDAWRQAYLADQMSAFGGILGINREMTMELAEEILAIKGFKLDALVAPKIAPDVLAKLTDTKKWGKELVIFETGGIRDLAKSAGYLDVKSVPGGLAVQSADRFSVELDMQDGKVVTKRAPTDVERAAFRFAVVMVKHVKSNAIVVTTGNRLISVGAGQMSRVDSVEIALKKAGEQAKGAVLASDAFFPFPDGPEAIAKAGITAIIQPGGSMKDQEVIAMCDKYNIAMIFTGIRHFKH